MLLLGGSCKQWKPQDPPFSVFLSWALTLNRDFRPGLSLGGDFLWRRLPNLVL